MRYGGGEFAVLFPNTEREQAFLRLENLRTVVHDTKIKARKDGAEITGLHISAGLACFPVDGHLKSELLREAMDDLLVKYGVDEIERWA